MGSHDRCLGSAQFRLSERVSSVGGECSVAVADERRHSLGQAAKPSIKKSPNTKERNRTPKEKFQTMLEIIRYMEAAYI
jgi:hypothetical protein